MTNVRYFGEILPVKDEPGPFFMGQFIPLAWNVCTAMGEIGSLVGAEPFEKPGEAGEKAWRFRYMVERLARAIHSIHGQIVHFSDDPDEDVRQRLAWAFDPVDGWPEPLVYVLNESYDAARGSLIQFKRQMESDPNSEAGRSMNGAGSEIPATSAGAPSMLPKSPTGNTTPNRTNGKKQSVRLPKGARS